MNKHLHRIVFNKHRGQLMAVAEHLSSDGKAPGCADAFTASPALVATLRPICFSILLACGLVGSVPAVQAQIVADPNAPRNQQPTVLNAPNGTPVVNIQTPSAAGVSRNTYQQFDVHGQGAILNNSRNNAQTQLGGWVQGNPWLARGTARVILNEVNSANPSQLLGFVEVAGDRVQVVIANPSGITCDGCGFINANRATLTTGTPVMNGGHLDGYRVQGGAIHVGGAGLDATRTDYTDLIARAVQVNAGIWAKALRVTTGVNEVSADHTRAAPTGATATAEGKPSYALDVGALGGMYAGKIALVGTEHGLGVRNAGQIGASAGEVIVTADGRIENSGRIGSSADTRLDAGGGIANTGTLYAQGDAYLSARGLIDNKGTIAAQGNTTLTASGGAGIHSHAGSVLGAGIASDGAVGGSGSVRLTADAQLVAHGRTIAGAGIRAAGARLDLAGSQIAARDVDLTARSGTLDASRATVQAAATLHAQAAGTLRTDGAAVSADALRLAAHDLSNRAGELVQTGTADLTLDVPGKIDNTDGRIATNSSNLTLAAAHLDNTRGRIEHAGAGTLAMSTAKVDGARGSVSSNGVLRLTAERAVFDGARTVAGTVHLDSATLSNRQGEITQTGTGAASILATTKLDNTGGTIASAGHTTLTVGDITNLGGKILVAGKTTGQATEKPRLDIHATGKADNGAGGKLGAEGALSLRASSVSNDTGQITAGGALDVIADGTVDNGRGVVAANGNVTVQGSSVDNRHGMIGSVQANATARATGGRLDNTSGRLEAAKSVTAKGHGLTNTDGVIAGNAVNLDSRGKRVDDTANNTLDNTRGTVAARDTLDVDSGKLVNDAGMLSAGGALRVDTHGQALSNTQSGTTNGILGQSAVTLATGALDNRNAGFVGARGDLTINATRITNGDGDGKGGQIAGGQSVTITGSGLDNRNASVQALGKLTVDVGTGTVNNTASLIRSGDALTIVAGKVINRDTQTDGKVDDNKGVAGKSVAVHADDVDNTHGSMRADTTLRVTGAGTVDNTQGSMAAGESLAIQDRDLANKSQAVANAGGILIANRKLEVDSASLSGNGKVLSRQDLSVRLSRDFTNIGTVQAAGNGKVHTDGKLVNQSVIQAGGTLDVSATDVENQAKGEISATTTHVDATRSITNRGLIDGARTRVRADTVINVGTGRLYGDRLAVRATTLVNGREDGKSAVAAARERLDLGAQTLDNQRHALLFSAGDMAIGQTLDANDRVTGRSDAVTNQAGSIEALGAMSLAAQRVSNLSGGFVVDTVQVGKVEHVVEYQGAGSPNRYRAGTPGVEVFNDESDHLRTPERNYEQWTRYEYDRTTTTTVLAVSDPGKITAGKGMHMDVGTLRNDMSQVIAGGAMTGTVGDLQNTEHKGVTTVTDVGTATSYWRDKRRGRDRTGSQVAAYTPPAVPQETSLKPSVYQQHTTPEGSGTQLDTLVTAVVVDKAAGAGAAQVSLGGGRQVGLVTEVASPRAAGATGPATVVRTGGPDTSLPDNALFRTNPGNSGGYLVETDPRFADYKSWLSSDYLLKELGFDPAATQKRLGDGFYEQKLIREQAAQLTGRRFLDGHAGDEAQYRALLEGGVTLARQWNLRPGVALSAEQMAQLTSDVVWLVEREVRLPDGQVTRALVPQVYVRVREGDIDGSGALLSARAIQLDLSGDLTNSGTIAGREVLAITAQNLSNLGGRITGNAVSLAAREDLTNLGGMIDANRTLAVTAGRDLNVASTTASASNAQGSVTGVSRVAGLYVTGTDGGTLVAAAGRNLTLAGAQVGNVSKDGLTVLSAGNDLNLSTVDTSHEQRLHWDAKNHRSESRRDEVGSTIHTQGDLRLSAGNDLSARGATVSSESGAIHASAGHDINLSTAQSQVSVDESHQHTGRSSMVSKTVYNTRDVLDQTTSQGSTLSGNTVNVSAGNDLRVSGSNVVSTAGTALAAGHDVTIEAATDTTTERHLASQKKSGLFGSGGIGFTYGTQQQTVDGRDTRQSASASTVGATVGNVSISAGNRYQQTGSHVLAPKGDIDIAAKKVDIVEARESTHSVQDTEFKQSGLTVAVTAPVIAALQTAQQMKSAAGKSGDARMQALAAGTTALAAKNTADQIAKDPKSGGGVSISITVGGSKSESRETQDSASAAGSTVAAGGDVRIRATGAGEDSTLTVRGSNVSAGGDALLKSDGKMGLLAAENSSETHRKSQSVSGGAGIGVSFDTKGGASFGFTANASASRGKGEGTEQNWTHSHVSAGNRLRLESGGDATLKGAIASANRVEADVGGKLHIESVQDKNSYHSKDQSASGSVTIGYGFSGSASASQQKIDSDYASVTEQSGIKAGDGGFDVRVKGNTHLQGGVIASNQKAVEDGVNRLSTGTLTYADVENRASYTASSVSVGGGFSVGGKGGGDEKSGVDGVGTNQKGEATTGGSKVPGSDLPASKGGASATLPIVMGARGKSSSTTHAGVSGATLEITDAEGQARTGQSVEGLKRDVSSEQDGSGKLKPIFDKQKIEAGFEIVGALQREAGTFLNNRAKEADELKQARDKESDPARRAELDWQYQDAAKWGPGGTYRQVATALTAAAGGNVTGSTGAFVTTGLVNYVQQQGAGMIGDLVARGDLKEGSPAHTALHAIVACAGAAASSQSCGAGAMGAATASLLTNLFADDAALSQSEKEARRNLVGTLVAGTAALTNASDAATATHAATAVADNNWLAHSEIVALNKAQRDCMTTGGAQACGKKSELEALSKRRDAQLAACEGSNSANCQQLREDVRNAYAEILRSKDLAPAADYAGEAGKTEAQADGTMSTADRMLGQIKGLKDSVVDGAKGALDLALSLAENQALADAAYAGDAGAYARLQAKADGIWETAKTLADPQLLANLSAAHRESLAKAYESGDAAAIGHAQGEALGYLANLPGGAGLGMVKKVGSLEDIAKAAKGADKAADTFWSSTKSKTAVENAYKHWDKHKSEFPEFQNARQYAEGSTRFLNNPPDGTMRKVRPNGDVILYNPKDNTFGIMSADGSPRTMFRPSPSEHGYPTNLEYFNAQ